MQQFENKHLGIRKQVFMRISDEISKNPDTAYKFISVVCDETSLNELAMIELMFKNSIKEMANIRNN